MKTSEQNLVEKFNRKFNCKFNCKLNRYKYFFLAVAQAFLPVSANRRAVPRLFRVVNTVLKDSGTTANKQTKMSLRGRSETTDEAISKTRTDYQTYFKFGTKRKSLFRIFYPFENHQRHRDCFVPLCHSSLEL